MRIRNVGTAVISGVLALLFVAGCVRGVVKTEIGPAEAGRKMMIAVYPTEYKNRVAQGLADRYRDRANVTLLPIRDLKSVDHREYDALVIIDQLMAWQMFNFESSWFIGKIEDPDERRKIVLYLTAGSPKDDYKFKGIDAMTGATAMDREAETIDAISGRIDALLATPVQAID